VLPVTLNGKIIHGLQGISQGSNKDGVQTYSIVGRDVNSAKAIFYVAWHMQEFDRHPFRPPLKGLFIRNQRLLAAPVSPSQQQMDVDEETASDNVST
jgi:hypothetical protein